MGLLIRPDGTEAEVLPADRKVFTYQELQAAVGGYAEAVGYCERNGTHMTILADEDGRMRQLPLNRTASRIAGKQLLGPVLFAINSEMGTDDDDDDEDEDTCPDCGQPTDECECD